MNCPESREHKRRRVKRLPRESEFYAVIICAVCQSEIRGVRRDEADTLLAMQAELEAAYTGTGPAQSLSDMKFRLLITICLADREDLYYFDDLQMAWDLIDDPMVRRRLEEEGLLVKADSCKRVGQSHWYHIRHNLGNAVRDELLVTWGLTKVDTEGN